MSPTFARLSVRPVVLCLLAVFWASGAGAADIRYGLKGLPTAKGNPYESGGPNADVLRYALFDGLTRLDADGNPVPALAERWEAVNATTWRFQLRRDVLFSNGEPFDAAAVQAAIEWLRSSGGERTPAVNAVREVSGIEMDGRFAVLIHTERPDAFLPNRLSSVSIVAPKAWAQLGPNAFAETPAGTGPFQFKAWENANGEIALESNDDSWRAPKVDGLILVNMPDPASRVQALLSGDIQIATGLDVNDIDAVQAGGALITSKPSFSVTAIAFRQDEGFASPLKDKRVRQALNYAINKTEINNTVFSGLAEPSGQPAGRWTQGFNPEISAYPFDPERAKALLFEAGIVAAFNLRFDVVTDRAPGDTQMFDEVARQLSAVGIQAEIRAVPYGQWIQSFASGIWPSETDGFSLPFDAMPANTIQSAMAFYSCAQPVPFFCDEELDSNIAAVQEEMDYTKRLELMDAIARKVHDLAPGLFLTEGFDLFAVGRNVRGFAVAGRVPVFEQITVGE